MSTRLQLSSPSLCHRAASSSKITPPTPLFQLQFFNHLFLQLQLKMKEEWQWELARVDGLKGSRASSSLPRATSEQHSLRNISRSNIFVAYISFSFFTAVFSNSCISQFQPKIQFAASLSSFSTWRCCLDPEGLMDKSFSLQHPLIFALSLLSRPNRTSVHLRAKIS